MAGTGASASGTAPTGALPKCRLHSLLLQCPSNVMHGRELMMRKGRVRMTSKHVEDSRTTS